MFIVIEFNFMKRTVEKQKPNVSVLFSLLEYIDNSRVNIDVYHSQDFIIKYK